MSKKGYGVCLGASTVSAVEIEKTENSYKINRIIRQTHEGDPKEVFLNVLKELDSKDNPVLITGRKFRKFVKIPSIIEPEAIEYALRHISKKYNNKKYDALVSAGGETFIVYRLDDNQRVLTITSGNKCASGTGEFFLQQIKRMGLSIEDAVKLADNGEPYSVSGRCSVFAKSDCTHALNKGVPKENVTAGLCKMIAQKIIELVVKVPHENIIIVGGTALNKPVIKYVKKELKNVFVPEEAPYFEALGCAIASFEKGKPLDKNTEIFHDERSNFTFLPPLKDAEQLVTFNNMEYGKAKDNDKCIVGLDVGSTTTKAVLLRISDNKFLASVYLRTNGNPVEASRECYKSILKQLNGVKVNIVGIGVTGSGRQIAGLYSLTDGIINEIIAHASAAAFFDKDVDTIFEIGGQDAKYMHLTNSVASDYAMNEACSAGTGSFLEEAAYESLGVKVEDIAEYALKAKRPPNFNDQCSAFISSDIKNAIHEDISKEDILAGLVYSICFNYVNRVKGHRQVGDKIFMQGGVCYNKAVPLAMASILKKPIVVPPEPGLMGAFGVALEVKKRMELGLIKEKHFSLEELIERKIVYEKPFICGGGKEKCDLKCEINRIKIEDKIYAFGGACNRYYNIRYNIHVDSEKLDLVKVRNDLMFNKYAPKVYLDNDALKIGINNSLVTHNLFPFYYNFFTNLGCKVVMPDGFNEYALNRQTTAFCYPTQLAIGFFDNLLEKEVDYYFLPQVEELYVPGGNQRRAFSSTCIFSQGEAFWLMHLYKEKNLKEKVLHPVINFRKGLLSQKKVFIEIGKKLGFSKRKVEEAFLDAIKMQESFEKECKEIGKKALEELKNNPEKIGIVLFGKPHVALTDDANKSIPKKVATRGYMIIPYDMIDFTDEELQEPFKTSMHWEIGQILLRVAQIVRRDKQLFGLYITNFLCAFDSFLVSHFRRVMKEKPSLTIELDGHTADAGINTRIDAFLDVIKNYIQVQKLLNKKEEKFIPSKIEIKNDKMFFVDSKGEYIPITDKRVKVLLPSMGDIGNRALAAAMQKVGINAVPLDIGDDEVRRLGRSVLTGKECIPIVICIGSLLKYLKYNKKEGEKIALFIPKAHGYCRLGQYYTTLEFIIKEKKIPDVTPFYLAHEVGYTGLGVEFSLTAWKAIVAADVLVDIRNALRTIAFDKEKALEIFEEEYKKILDSISGRSNISFYKQLELSAKRFKGIKTKIPFEKAPQVIILGEIFVRRDSFANNYLSKMLAEKGFIAKVASISEWIYYNNYLIKRGIFDPENTLKEWIEFYISDATQLFIERKIKKILEKSGLYSMEKIDIESILKFSRYVVPDEMHGEPGLSAGRILKEGLNNYAGVINIGPFGCAITRFSEAIISNNLDVKDKINAYNLAREKLKLKDYKETEKIPYLTIETDATPYPPIIQSKFESFCLQAERVAKKQGKIITNGKSG